MVLDGPSSIFFSLIRGRNGSIRDHPLVASSLVFGLRVMAAASSFGFTILITRSFGASGAGLFFTGLAVATAISVVFRFGSDGATLKFVAREYGVGSSETVRSYLRLGLVTTLLGGTIGSLVLYGGMLAGIRFFELDTGYGTFLAVFCLSILPLSLLALLSESLKGIGRVALSVSVSGILNFVVAGVLFYPFYAIFGDFGVIYSYLVGLCATVFYALFILRDYLRPVFAKKFSFKDYLKSLRYFWFTSILNHAVGPYAPLLLLSVTCTVEQVGLLATATRVAMVVSLFLAAANTVLAPRISKLYYVGNLSEICGLCSNFAFVQNLLVMPLLMAMVFGRTQLMGVFGAEFIAGASAFAVLAAGQAFNSLTGSVGTILVMSGHERDVWRSSVTGTGIMLVSSILLVPPYEAFGAAIAVTLGVVITNTAALFFVYRRLGFYVLPWPRKSGCTNIDTGIKY